MKQRKSEFVTTHHFDTTIRKLDQKIDDSVARLDKKIDDSVARLDKKIDDSVARLDKKIDDSVAKLENRIDVLDQKIDDSVAKLDSKITGLDQKIDDKVDMLGRFMAKHFYTKDEVYSKKEMDQKFSEQLHHMKIMFETFSYNNLGALYDKNKATDEKLENHECRLKRLEGQV
ncbi:MAG: hypothetical protein HY390_06125 [Deltaproteobacteria bacterium]|nr:hypothetical protein [Deltaproteobacteria bacterium]